MVDPIILTIITVIFVALTIFLGWYGFRSTRDNDQFLLGKNKANSILIALSYGATFLSTSAIVGFGGMASTYGLALVWLAVLCILVGTIVAFMLFGKRTRRIGSKLGAQTLADMLGKRFQSPFIRAVVALIIIVGMPIYCAAVLIGGVNVLTATVGIDKNTALLALAIIVALYVTIGGVIAVMYNDALQAAVMFVGMVIILFVAFWQLGGVENAFVSLQNLWNTKLTLDPGFASNLISKGFNGWSEMPDFGSPIWFMVVTTLLMGVGVGSIAQPQLAVRFMSAKDDKTLNKSMAIGAVFIFIILGTAFTIGPLSNVYFYDHTAGHFVAMEFITNADEVIPTFVDMVFGNLSGGDIFISVFIISLICATISTMAALLHTMGSAAGYDLWTQIQERRGQKTEIHNVKALRSSRIATLIMIVVVVIMAYVMPGNIIAKATTIFMGLTASAILPTFAYALYSKNPNASVAKVSIIVGAIAWSFWGFFIESGTATKIGLCNMIFHQPTLVTGIVNSVDPLVIGLPISFLALIIAYFVMKGTGKLES